MESESLNLDQTLFSENKMFEATPITNFYSGKSVFVTGGTGFLGTILLGKLLTTCPVKRVYLLIKPKKGISVLERMEELIKSPVFDALKKNNINALSNLIPITGNISEKKLGISEEDITLLNQEVQVVFHIAANIDMCTNLTDAIEANTKATAELVHLCKGMQRLKVFLYVSTAYSNCNRRLIDERVYEPATSLEAVYDLYKPLDKAKNQRSIQNLMEGRPNTYTYSKSLAENIIKDEFLEIPAVIVRPSIIVSPVKDPMPGWTVSWNGVNKVASSISEGILWCWFGTSNSVLDIVPVDQVANLIIATAWDADKQHLKTVKVFNCCTGLQNSITLGDFLGPCARVPRKYSDKLFCTNMLIINDNVVLHNILWFFLQVVPAYLHDIFAWLIGRKTRMMKINKSLVRAKAMLAHFCLNEYTFIDYNVRRLLRDMDPIDQTLFDFDFSALDWQSFMEDCVLGFKKYLPRK